MNFAFEKILRVSSESIRDARPLHFERRSRPLHNLIAQSFGQADYFLMTTKANLSQTRTNSSKIGFRTSIDSAGGVRLLFHTRKNGPSAEIISVNVKDS